MCVYVVCVGVNVCVVWRTGFDYSITIQQQGHDVSEHKQRVKAIVTEILAA